MTAEWEIVANSLEVASRTWKAPVQDKRSLMNSRLNFERTGIGYSTMKENLQSRNKSKTEHLSLGD